MPHTPQERPSSVEESVWTSWLAWQARAEAGDPEAKAVLPSLEKLLYGELTGTLEHWQ
jgi:hypothetical protein